MLQLGSQFPTFKMTAVKPVSGEELKSIINSDPSKAFYEVTNPKDKWLVIFSHPMDFTFVCPTEIAAFGKLSSEFADRDAEVINFSTDSEFVHLNWRLHHPDLLNLSIPMAADIKRELSSALGILDEVKGVAQRATYIVDPTGKISFVMVTDLNVGRNPNEVLRVLDALQTDELCPCNWKKGEKTLNDK